MSTSSKLYKYLSISLMIILLASLLSVHKKASAYEGVLPINSSMDGVLTKEIDSVDYIIQVPKAGRLTIDLTSYVDKLTYIKLEDSNNEEVYEKYIEGTSKNPARLNFWKDLEAGTYTLTVYDGSSWSTDTGNFTVKTSFIAADNNEVEPNNGTVEAQPISFESLITGFLSWNDTKDMYKVMLEKAGRLTVDLSSYVDTRTYIALHDENNERVFETDVEGNSKTPSKYNKWVDLEPGTYYVSIFDGSSWSSDTGKYMLKTSFVPAYNNEVEPNNGTVDAQALSFFQTVTGFLAWNDPTDVYKISVPKDGQVSIDLTSYVDSRTYIQLTNNNNDELFAYDDEGSSKNPLKFKRSVTLNKGTYFIKVYDGSSWNLDTGKYQLEVSMDALLPTVSIPSVTDQVTAVKGSTSANAEVVVFAGKEYKGKADYRGNFSINIPKQKAGTKIQLKVKNLYGAKSISIIVADKTPPITPSVGAITSKSSSVAGKAEAGSIVYIINGNKEIGKVKVLSNGSYKVNIAPQKKGSTLKAYAKDGSGNKSQEILVKVK